MHIALYMQAPIQPSMHTRCTGFPSLIYLLLGFFGGFFVFVLMLQKNWF